MSMDLIERLQKKPERERKQIALALTLALFAGILLLWGVLLRADRPETPVSLEREAPSPFEALANVLKTSMNTEEETFERAPAPLAPEETDEVGGGVVVEQTLATATTSAEVVPEEGNTLEVLPPPAP